MPGYSRDGHALIYGSYICGNMCGYGWLFLLKGQGTDWQVVSAHLLWIT